MKELNEYKNEIFRRSAEKKRQIRKRRRIAIGVGIPLCLCCVITVAMLPQLSMKKDALLPNMEAACDKVMGENFEMQEMPMKVFQVTDPTDAAMVLDILKDTDPEYTLNRENLDEENTLADQAQPSEYLLAVQHPDGNTVNYRIRGLVVYCEDTGGTLWLSDEQADRLYKFVTQVAAQK